MLDTIIVGGGMAGMTAALYCLRNNKKVLVIEKETIGGQISMSPKVENYPTIQQISGTELADLTFEQISNLGVQFEIETVEKIDKKDNYFTVKTNYNSYKAKSVILATGASPRRLGLKNEEKFIGHGIYFCAICDGPFFANKDVTVIGDANSAMQYALMLAGYCKSVTIITLFDKFFGEQNLKDAILKTSNITVIHNSKSISLDGDDELRSITFEKPDGTTFVHETNAAFVAIGQKPDNTFVQNLVEIDKAGYIVADEKCKTKTDGLFVAGDCRTKEIRQVATAVGDGATAATNACKYLNSLEV
ncbi:MAG: FAD-dependent oxidoreductase [Clostridia bacterium]|nr:FAD-dependent oxidoreductase [Clostridia bacterium]